VIPSQLETSNWHASLERIIENLKVLGHLNEADQNLVKTFDVASSKLSNFIVVDHASALNDLVRIQGCHIAFINEYERENLVK
jgi:hypothetical protein